ncbi:heavy metal-associated isoprenylated plant protein 3-like [Papaver somniferum]|uniref:heavy metal-associated isoprenylated plant protein 3-like n=1 Tax=Papaver somniferum TaxID=3469 RepID=UPI000E700054|nr:heavy metal-associated isoprenylated plant protein 3-like [Papaver somniferum]
MQGRGLSTMFRVKNILEFPKTMRRKLQGRGLSSMFRRQNLGIFSKILTRRLKKGVRIVKLVGVGIYSLSSKFVGTLKNSYMLIKTKRRKIRRKLPDTGEKIVEGENGEQEDDGVETVTIVLKVGMHNQCNGCVKKVIKSVQSFEGVAKTQRDSASATNEITVIGKRVDPVKLREYVALKTKKKVELISPLPKKPEKETPNEKKVVKKQAPQVMRVDSDSFRVDKANNFVKVKGTMDVTELTTCLKQKLKRDVHIYSTKAHNGGEEKDGDEMKENGGGGSCWRTEGEGAKIYEHPRGGPRQRNVYEYGYGYENRYNYGPGNGYGVDHVRQDEMFSDENPYFCSIM